MGMSKFWHKIVVFSSTFRLYFFTTITKKQTAIPFQHSQVAGHGLCHALANPPCSYFSKAPEREKQQTSGLCRLERRSKHPNSKKRAYLKIVKIMCRSKTHQLTVEPFRRCFHLAWPARGLFAPPPLPSQGTWRTKKGGEEISRQQDLKLRICH